MIYVNRSSVPDPFQMNSDLQALALREFEAAKETVANYGSPQRSSDFTAFCEAEVSDALRKLFSNKCAYCETPIGKETHGGVVQHRPFESVLEAPNHPGYWWLANDWNNLFLACHTCSKAAAGTGGHSGKGNRFPLADGSPRAGDPGEEAEEIPLLIDPTAIEPAEELVFMDDGSVVGLRDIGNATIEVFNLNRPSLVEARLKRCEELIGSYLVFVARLFNDTENLNRLNVDEAIDDLRSELHTNKPYLGLSRQLLRTWLEDFGDGVTLDGDSYDLSWIILQGLTKPARTRRLEQPDPKDVSKYVKQIAGAYPAYLARDDVKEEGRISQAKYRNKASLFSLLTLDGNSPLPRGQNRVERIEISNLRAIADLNIKVSEESESGLPWLMLLGENGTGKSSILQAVSLALAGPGMAARLIHEQRLRPDTFIRAERSSAEVHLKLNGFDSLHSVVIDRKGLVFSAPGQDPVTVLTSDILNSSSPPPADETWPRHTMLLGYGATRVASSDGAYQGHGDGIAQIGNLFDAFVALRDPQTWLLSLPPATFNDVASIFLKVFELVDGEEFDRSNGVVWLKKGDISIPIRQLSDGYQSIISVLSDVMATLIANNRNKNFQDGQAIVIIDEIDAHLHPLWQMRIVSRLRAALPEVQFITTTHQPLCLRGLSKDEVALLYKDEDWKVRATTDLPEQFGYHVDNLLTMPFFGLHSTMSEETEALYARYYQLLKETEGSKTESDELGNIRSALRAGGQFGRTQREDLFYRVLDEFLAQSEEAEMPDISDSAVKELAKRLMRLKDSGIDDKGKGKGGAS